jgi:hypothetical protein
VFFIKEKSYITLIKSNDGEANVDEQLQNTISVKASAKQIAKQWILKESKSSPGTNSFTKQQDRPWFDFKPDGSYSRMTIRIKKGHWYFENNNTSIALIDENGEGQLWNILSVSSNQLVIQKPNTDGRQIFEVNLPPKKSGSVKNNSKYSEVENPK